MAKVREVDFVTQFGHNILPKLMEALGVTRKIPMEEGTTLYVYNTTGTLQNGAVPEGEIIPLSQYARTKTPVGEITLKKWRKASTAEAIKKSGFDEAVTATDKKLLNDVQKGVRTDFFDFITGLDATVVAADTLQKVLAKIWGNLQVLFEDDAVSTVHFINPLTVSDYLGTATITMQTAFGMNYIEDFLGLGTVVMNSNIPQGQVISTAKDNLVLYYLTMNGDIASAFGLSADETGYIGIKSGYANEERAQIESLVMSGISLFVDYADGVVIGQIDSTPSLGSITVTSEAATVKTGDTKLTCAGYGLGTGEKFVYKTAKTTAPAVTYGQKLGSTWTEFTSGDEVTPNAADHTKVTVAAIDANGRAQAAGNDDLVVKE
ncbi:MAG: hypothetical protein IKO36_02090 [Bacteroidaceae bacterium]|nr:hypothetical protein [Bacteroidaceae bacterium]